DRKRLLRLMARIAEASYRRSFQHGVEVGDRRIVDAYLFRFDAPLDAAPYTDRIAGHTSIDRLLMEHDVLREVGFADDSFYERAPLKIPRTRRGRLAYWPAKQASSARR